MVRFFKRSLVVTAVIGVFAGFALALTAEKFDQVTTTDSFCTGCHTMQTMADQQTYKNSKHRTTSSGVRAGCADCHVPKGLLASTWAHLYDGSRDLIAEWTSNHTPETWKARRVQLAYRVRDWMLSNDSRTCRSCHTDQFKPKRERGQRQHELAKRNKITCIGCHFDLVHSPVRPRQSFLEKVQVRPKR